MAFDSLLYLRDAAVSGSFFTGDSTQLTSRYRTKNILLPSVPLRGLNLNVVLPAAVSTPSLQVALLQAVSTGATFTEFRRFPAITTSGDWNYRFHLDPGNYAVSASLTITGSSGAGVGNLDIRIGLDLGAHGNANPS